jgi:hypothetical protein
MPYFFTDPERAETSRCHSGSATRAGTTLMTAR